MVFIPVVSVQESNQRVRSIYHNWNQSVLTTVCGGVLEYTNGSSTVLSIPMYIVRTILVLKQNDFMREYLARSTDMGSK